MKSTKPSILIFELLTGHIQFMSGCAYAVFSLIYVQYKKIKTGRAILLSVEFSRIPSTFRQ